MTCASSSPPVPRSRCLPSRLQVLAAHRILSAPVVTTGMSEAEATPDTADPTDRIKDVAGFIDIRDILSSFLQGECRAEGEGAGPAGQGQQQLGQQTCSSAAARVGAWQYCA